MDTILHRRMTHLPKYRSHHFWQQTRLSQRCRLRHYHSEISGTICLPRFENHLRLQTSRTYMSCMDLPAHMFTIPVTHVASSGATTMRERTRKSKSLLFTSSLHPHRASRLNSRTLSSAKIMVIPSLAADSSEFAPVDSHTPPTAEQRRCCYSARRQDGLQAQSGEYYTTRRRPSTSCVGVLRFYAVIPYSYHFPA